MKTTETFICLFHAKIKQRSSVQVNSLIAKSEWSKICEISFYLHISTYWYCKRGRERYLISRESSLKSNMWYFQFSIWLKRSLEEEHFAETLPESDKWFQSYEQLKDYQNKRKQKKFIPFSGYISQSMPTTSDWFCFIATHIINTYICKHVWVNVKIK